MAKDKSSNNSDNTADENRKSALAQADREQNDGPKKTVNVRQTFDLMRDDGSEERFVPGEQEVSEEDSKHWAMRANTVGGDKNPIRAGSYEFHTQSPAHLEVTQVLLDIENEEQLEVAKEAAEFNERRSESASKRREGYKKRLDEAAASKPAEFARNQRVNKLEQSEPKSTAREPFMPGNAASSQSGSAPA